MRFVSGKIRSAKGISSAEPGTMEEASLSNYVERGRVSESSSVHVTTMQVGTCSVSRYEISLSR